MENFLKKFRFVSWINNDILFCWFCWAKTIERLTSAWLAVDYVKPSSSLGLVFLYDKIHLWNRLKKSNPIPSKQPSKYIQITYIDAWFAVLINTETLSVYTVIQMRMVFIFWCCYNPFKTVVFMELNFVGLSCIEQKGWIVVLWKFIPDFLFKNSYLVLPKVHTFCDPHHIAFLNYPLILPERVNYYVLVAWGCNVMKSLLRRRDCKRRDNLGYNV